MSTNSELTPPLESFSGILAFLQRLAQVCVQTMPWLLLGSAVIGAAQVGLSSLSSQAQQVGFGLELTIIFLPLVAGWVLLITALNSFIAASASVALGATTIPLGQALSIAARRLPRVIGYSLVAFCAFAAGLICLILPGLYLAMRLFPVALVALFEPDVNALKRSWEFTQHRTLEVVISYVLVLAATFVSSLAIGLTIGLLPSIPGFMFLSATLNTLLTYTIPFVFWLLLYGWFRADIYEPPVAGPEEAYAEA